MRRLRCRHGDRACALGWAKSPLWAHTASPRAGPKPAIQSVSAVVVLGRSGFCDAAAPPAASLHGARPAGDGGLLRVLTGVSGFGGGCYEGQERTLERWCSCVVRNLHRVALQLMRCEHAIRDYTGAVRGARRRGGAGERATARQTERCKGSAENGRDAVTARM